MLDLALVRRMNPLLWDPGGQNKCRIVDGEMGVMKVSISGRIIITHLSCALSLRQ
jgi:hypothetical protein